MSQDAIERALTELAARADTHPTPDVVPAVHRRIRRNAAVRATAVAATVAAVVAGVSVLAADGLPFARSAPPSREVPPSGPRLTVELHSSPDLAASLPRKQPGIPAVVEVVVRGDLPTGQGWPVERSILGVQVDWGDGAYGGQGAYGPSRTPDPAAAASCPPAGQLRQWASDEPMTHHYQRPGTYTVTYRALACGLPGEVTKSIELTVTEP